MQATVEKNLRSRLATASQIVVAYSGGLDSTVLLHLVNKIVEPLAIELLAVYVNHHLSPNADLWQDHCQQQCQAWHIPFVAKSVHLRSKEQNIEAQARKLRYAALAQTVKPNGLLVTGQHQQDQIETLLIQLKRGAGPKGLSCMAASSAFATQATLLRPLLDLTRTALEQYAKQHQIHWIEDESNLDCRFDRNFIRHQLLPTVQQRWPGFATAASRSIALIAEQQQLVEEMAIADLEPLRRSANSLDGQLLQQLSNPRQRNVLRFWIANQNVLLPSQQVLDKLVTEVIEAKQDANPKVQWAGYQLRRYRHVIYLFDHSIEQGGVDCLLILNQPLVLNDQIGVLSLSDYAEGGGEGLGEGLGLTLRRPTADEPIWLRFNVNGLACKPQGSPHTRKLKDLFKDHNIPPWQRQRTPLIYYGETLAAVAGMFVCQGFAADPANSANVVNLVFNPCLIEQ